MILNPDLCYRRKRFMILNPDLCYRRPVLSNSNNNNNHSPLHNGKTVIVQNMNLVKSFPQFQGTYRFISFWIPHGAR
jgi:hypothetical protein